MIPGSQPDPVADRLNSRRPGSTASNDAGTEPDLTSSDDPPRRIACGVLFLAYFALWTVLGRYWGLQHDAQHYAVQALGKLKPEIYAGDLFLRFSSQDEFTIFPYICAWVFRLLDLDAGAALLTLGGYVAWVLAAWLLGRALVGPRLAWLSVGLLVAVPGWYGAGQVFRTAEPFLSARTLAEAVSIGALTATVQGRRWTAISLVLLALLTHPIMAFPVLLAMFALMLPWRRSRIFWPAIAGVLFIGAVTGSAALGRPTALMSSDWLQMTRARSSYLFLGEWSTADWQTNLVPLLSALLSVQLLSGWSRRLAAAAFWIGTTGLALAAFSGAALPLTFLLQGQPWRWVWLSGALSLLLLPATVRVAWRGGAPGRIVAFLACTAWLLVQWSSGDQVPPVGTSSLLLGCAVLVARAGNAFSSVVLRILHAGTLTGLAVAVIGLSMSVIAILRGRFVFGTDPAWVEAMADVLRLTGAAMLAVAAAWWLTVRDWTSRRGLAVAALASAIAIASGPGAAATWLAVPYTGAAHATFSSWRSRIPLDAEVFWPGGLQETWFLLERRSYLSRSQLAGMVFSEELAHEARRRRDILTPLFPQGYWFMESSPTLANARRRSVDEMARACTAGGPDFVVAEVGDEGDDDRIVWPIPGKFAYLLDCALVRPDDHADDP